MNDVEIKIGFMLTALAFLLLIYYLKYGNCVDRHKKLEVKNEK